MKKITLLLSFAIMTLSLNNNAFSIGLEDVYKACPQDTTTNPRLSVQSLPQDPEILPPNHDEEKPKEDPNEDKKCPADPGNC